MVNDGRSGRHAFVRELAFGESERAGLCLGELRRTTTLNRGGDLPGHQARFARGEPRPPRSKAWFYGPEGYWGRKKACIECLANELCLCRASDYKKSFCITDALLAAAIKGDTENGLFYTGQSLTGLTERDATRLPTVAEIMAQLEQRVAREDVGLAAQAP